MPRYAVFIVSLLFIVQACNQPISHSGREELFILSGDSTESGQVFSVIYSLHLPTDISRLFEETGTGFNPDLLMPHERIPLYDDPGQMALLLGALGVDLSYCKLFDRFLESAECYNQIELLADNLNLPGEIFEKTSVNIERYMDNPDSLTELINQVYSDVDKHFKENGQEALASLSLLGGWFEAMYIAVNIYEENSMPEMGDRILLQKFALTSLSGLLSNYQESLIVRKYMHSLIRLKEVYEQVDIRYTQEGFRINHEERMLYGSVAELIYEPESLMTIGTLIKQVWEGINL